MSFKVAIKVVEAARFKSADQKGHMKNEMEICKLFASKLKHGNIVNVHEVINEEDQSYIIMENVQGGDLYQRIKYGGKLSEKQTKIWFRELVSSIAYIHKANNKEKIYKVIYIEVELFF